jgi:hypothetical protein
MFILVVIDAFSRWGELYPTATTTAVKTASCIFQHFGRFGNPDVVHTDRGTAFHRGAAADDRSRAVVDHGLLRHLNAILFDSRVHDRWSLEQLNTVEKTSTGVTPAQLILNNSIKLSKQILRSNRVSYPPDTTSPLQQIALSDRMDDWISKQSVLLRILSHLHVLYTVRTIHTAHCTYCTCSLFPCFRC